MGDERLQQLQHALVQLAGRDYAARAPVSAARDDVDAICVGVNLLAEELAHEHDERTQAQALLREAIEAYEHAPAMFCSVEGQARVIVRCNQTMARTLGTTCDALVGQTLPSLSQAPDATRDALDTLTATGGEAPEVLWLDAPEAPVPVRMAAVPLTGAPNGRLQVVLRNARADLQAEATERQRQKMRALAELSGGLAHDLNNLLSVVMMVSAAAREASPGDLELLLADLESAAQSGAALAQRLLTTSVEGMQRLHVDPSDALRAAAQLALRAAPAAVRVATSLPASLPTVAVDPTELERVVLNLATNAIDAMPEGGDMAIEARHGDDEVRVTVSDTGTGMSAEIRARAVEPLFTTKPHGNGFGLALAYALCERAGGSLDLQSELGAGTTITLHLPTTA